MITAVKTARVKASERDKPLENVKIKIDTTSDVITVETETTKEKAGSGKIQGGSGLRCSCACKY